MAAKLGYYVYLYVNPLNKSIFYVGKGKSGRALSHLNSHEKRAITQAIGEIRAAGEEPQIEILAHGLSDPDALVVCQSADLAYTPRSSGRQPCDSSPLFSLPSPAYPRSPATRGSRIGQLG